MPGVEDRLVVRFLTARKGEFERIFREYLELVCSVSEPRTVDPEGYKTERTIFLARPDVVDDEGPAETYVHKARQMRDEFMAEIGLGTHLSIVGWKCYPGDINESR